MAGIDFGKSGARRALNHEIPLIPFIDCLLCLVAFLLVTAVWTDMARLQATARVPGGRPDEARATEERVPELHVALASGDRLSLEWRRDGTVIEQEHLSRSADRSNDGLRYPALKDHVERLWARHGVHRAPSDRVRDRAVVHAPNATEFEEIAAVMDSVSGVERPFDERGATVQRRAFDVTFAAD